MAGLTPKLPLILSNEDGTYTLIKKYKELVKQNFKNLILTAAGERMMDPQFGVGIKNYLFENDGPDLYSSISNKIKEQTTKYMPFVGIINIDFRNSEAYNNFLSVEIQYVIGPLDVVDNLLITMPHN